MVNIKERETGSTEAGRLPMKTPPVVSAEEWEAARQQLLVKEKALTRARDALAAERRRMPWLAVEKAYVFDGPKGKASLLDLFDGRRQLIVYRAFFEPGVFGWPEHACRGCSLGADQVAHLSHLNARDTTLAYASRAPQADIARLKARMGWEMPWYTITDGFDKDFGVDEWHGHNAFIRNGDDVFRTYFINNRADEAMGTTWSYLDLTRSAVRRSGRTRRRVTRKRRLTSGGTGTTTTRSRPRLTRSGSGVRRWSCRHAKGLRKGWLAWLQLRGWKSHDARLRNDAPEPAFLGVSALLFAVSAAVTIVWCTSMSAIGGMPMPGGWTMSMAWMRMPGQTWPGAAASFLGMWVVMMVAMMLPSLVPMLKRYRQAVGRIDETRLGLLTAIVGAGYFFVWTVFGMAVFPLGAALAAMRCSSRRSRALYDRGRRGRARRRLPAVHRVEGASPACCREASASARADVTASYGETVTAWRHGLRLGLHCCQCCAGLIVILLVSGVIGLRAMAVVTAAITAERLAPAGERLARTIGAVVVSAGVFLIARAALGTP